MDKSLERCAAYINGLKWAELSDGVEFADMADMAEEERLAFRDGYHDGRRVMFGLGRSGTHEPSTPAAP